jgi:protein-tyrosine phosphatase
MSGQRFEILFVCTANICRSPMAERLAARYLGDVPDLFGVSGAGTRGQEGSEMHPHAEQTLRSLGASADGFQARRLTAAHLAGADLVLTATREHRSACVSLDPVSLGRVFTIPQFARLAEVMATTPIDGDDPVTRARAVVREAVRARALLQPISAELDEIADPIGRPQEAFDACGELLQRELGPTLRLLAGI